MSTVDPTAKSRRDVVVIGASAGGLAALKILLHGLPAALPAAVFVVLHSTKHQPNHLLELLAMRCSMPVVLAEDDSLIVFGQVHLSVPGKHLLLQKDRIRLTNGPKEHFVRPAIDVLFRTAASSFGSRVIGVVLSGNLDDGTAGLQVIKAQGGVAIVQLPSEAVWPSMPTSAIENVGVDAVLPAAEISERIISLVEPINVEGHYCG